jgi:hypothetical protein
MELIGICYEGLIVLNGRGASIEKVVSEAAMKSIRTKNGEINMYY